MSIFATTRRRASLLLILALLLTCAAQAGDDRIPSSGYQPAAGDRFFLLADSSFGPAEEAQVRLEAPGRDHRRFMLEGYGGADIRVYRVPEPLEFLRRQRNLHRLDLAADYRGEGLSNTLAFLWDSWYRQSRRAMQRAFSFDARQVVTEQAPELKVGEALVAPTPFAAQPQFAPIAGLPLVAEFRYPLWDARPIEPPAGVELAGSSSEFIDVSAGNVQIPLGRLAPGLYVVEALIGNYRATTAVFVSNTVAVTKIAGGELLVWTARKDDGRAVPGVELLWTDGLGVLSSGRSDARGLLQLAHASPERSYVLGQDPDGGVFVSENFYYDSEIYDLKLYAFTDRPLYRPGDRVAVRIVGREYVDARTSRAAPSGPLRLAVVDANGTELQAIELPFDGETGADTQFQLPHNATAGGYELRMEHRGQLYGAAFRVAEYIKPHFEIALELDRAEHRAGDPVEGWLTLVYPDGKPVAGARIEVSLRAQQLSTVDNELQYLGAFPVELTHTTLRSGVDGRVRLQLPSATQPSRYLLTLFASDGAAFRVRTTEEILVERAATTYRIETAQRFTPAGQPVEFRLVAAGEGERRPAAFSWVRLEDQSRGGNRLRADQAQFTLPFERAGTYALSVTDSTGMVLGATGHSVSGDGVTAMAGSIAIVLDRDDYAAGDVAEALITFPEPVQEALLTLERDRVEQAALLTAGADWLALQRISDTQYRARIPVGEAFAPNLTFSVLSTSNGEYSFENAGIKVRVPTIDVDIATDGEVYRPGDTVTVTVQTTLAGDPLPAQLTVAVVDEMIHALQPEIAPAIDAFFNHPRRNNVRTSASLSFISYDVALPGVAGPPASGNRSERAVKLLERPRRDDVDTAAWQPRLSTGADGRAQFTFTMPDSLTRWRITARAIDADGRVGQRRSFVRSDQPLYLKWSGPTVFRAGDAPALGLLAFNQAGTDVAAELRIEQAGEELQRAVTLAPGVDFVALPEAVASGELQAALLVEGAEADRLAVRLERVTDGWPLRRSQALLLTDATSPLALPADARAIELTLAQGPHGLFRTALDDLLEYPWACIEHTASRLLPLALAYPLLADAPVGSDGDARQAAIRDRLRLALQTARLRLVQMAGPEAHFGWCGDGAEPDAFLTAYAYYADWHASRALGLPLPTEHWLRMLELYGARADRTPLLQRVLALDFARRMQLPIDSLLQQLLDELGAADDGDAWADASERASLVLVAPDSRLGIATARLLGARLAADVGVALPAALAAQLPRAEQRLADSPLPFADAVRQFRAPLDAATSVALFQQLSPEQATIERALTLSWLAAALQAPAGEPETAPQTPWRAVPTATGAARWRWQGAGVPDRLLLDTAPDTPLAARIDYDSAAEPASTLPVSITRRLYRLVPGDSALAFSVEPVPDGVVQTGVLYLDEIVLRQPAERALRYGLVEVPLPPGADVERTTWGIQVSGLAGIEAASLEKARHVDGERSYAVPVDTLPNELTIRHLLRFAQRGRFTLPPVRYQQIHAPDRQALEVEPPLATLRVE